MSFERPLLLQIFWPIGLVLIGLIDISCVLGIFLQAYLVFCIWMQRLVLMSEVRTDDFLIPFNHFILFFPFLWTYIYFRMFGLRPPTYVFAYLLIVLYFSFYFYWLIFALGDLIYVPPYVFTYLLIYFIGRGPA